MIHHMTVKMAAYIFEIAFLFSEKKTFIVLFKFYIIKLGLHHLWYLYQYQANTSIFGGIGIG